MLLDADASEYLARFRASGRPPFEGLSVEEAREAYSGRALTVQRVPPAPVRTSDLLIPGPAGDLRARLYRGDAAEEGTPSPCLLFLHGGGFVLGGLESHDNICRHLAAASGASVLALDYRLAPEHRFPAGLEDAKAAFDWLAREAGALGVDPRRLAIGGDSAGGALSAGVALAAARREGPRPCAQLLFYPVLDLAGESAGYARIADGVPLSAASMRWFRDHYLGNDRAAAIEASPLRAESLAGTPATFLVTAGQDPLCEEGQVFVRRMEAEGAPVIHLHFANQLHGFLTVSKLIRAADFLLDTAAAWLKLAWA